VEYPESDDDDALERAGGQARSLHAAGQDDAEQQFRALAGALPHIAWIAHPDGQIDYYNQCWFDDTGLTLEQTKSGGWESVLHPEDARTRLDCLRYALATGEGYEVEYRLRGADGVYRWRLERATPVRASDGRIVRWFGLCTDIDNQKRAEAERARLLAREQQARAEMERVRADAVARVAERDVVFEAMVDGVFVCDRAGQALYMNGAYRRLLGLTAASETLVRRPEGRGYVFTARDVVGRPLSPEEWPMARVLRGEVMTGGQTLDLLVRTLDGREVALNATGAPVYDALGRVDGGVVSFREVTERRAVERRTHAALDALLAMARALVRGPELAEEQEGSEEPDDLASLRAVGYQLIELARNVLNCSHVGMIGVTPALDLQPLVQVGLSPEQEQQWRVRIGGRQLSENTAIYETLRARLAAGESLVFDTTRAPFNALSNPFGLRAYLVTPMCVGTTLVGLLSVAYGDDGVGDGRGVEQVYSEGVIALAGAVARLAALVIERERLLRERHEARATELALRAANARMEEFLSIAGHELRTPLTSILGNVQLMERWMDSARQMSPLQGDEASAPLDRVRGLLDRVERQTRLIDRLVNDLLDASRVQAGQLSLRMERHDLLLLTRDIVREQRQSVPRRVAPLEAPDQTPVWVHADGDRIAQVLTNYLTNALKYSADDTPIVVGLDVGVDGTMARVWVRDEGPGLDVAEQERVWDRFYRSADVEHRTGSSVGQGLGLYISRTIVERHGGRVGVESAPGAGATFWFALPTIDGVA